MTLLPCIFVSVLLLLSASSALFRATSSLKDGAELVTLLRARERATYEAVLSLPDRTTVTRIGMECTRVVGASGKVTIKQEGCSLKRPVHETSPSPYIVDGRLRKDSLFPFIKVPIQTTADSKCALTPDSTLRSEGSIRSQRTQILSENLSGKLYTAPCNVSLPAGLSVPATNDNTITEIYARGFIAVEQLLLLESDIILIALGDIALESVVIGSEGSLTVVSITGRVEIHTFAGSSRVSLWGRKGVFIPANLVPLGGKGEILLNSTIPLSVQNLELP